MVTPKNSQPKEEIYTEIWQRIARSQSVRESGTWAGRLQSRGESARLRHQQLGDILGRPLPLALAGGLTVFFLGTSLFLAFSATGRPEGPAFQASDPARGEVGRAWQDEPASQPPKTRQVPLLAGGTSASEADTSEADGFMVQLGTFRDPRNAERLAEALEQQASAFRMATNVNGLHTVALGPFDRRVEAEAAASAIQETLGLVPLVLRLELP